MHRNLTAAIRSQRTRHALRILAAVLILLAGADHYYEYAVDGYSVLPTIGTLFLLNFISTTAIGVILLAPLDRILRRAGSITLRLAAVTGFGIATTSLVALLVSEQTKVFGFMESNYRPAIIVAIASEATAAALLGLLFVVTRTTKRSVSGSRPTLPNPPSPAPVCHS